VPRLSNRGGTRIGRFEPGHGKERFEKTEPEELLFVPGGAESTSVAVVPPAMSKSLLVLFFKEPDLSFPAYGVVAPCFVEGQPNSDDPVQVKPCQLSRRIFKKSCCAAQELG
jgi:hypothetical protein